MSTTRFTDDDLRRLLDIEAGDVGAPDDMVGRVRDVQTDRSALPRRVRQAVLPALAAAVVVVVVALAMTIHAGGHGTNGASGRYAFSGAQNPPDLISVDQRRPAADVSGPLLSGSGRYDVATDARGKITVINFWGAWCWPCQVETPQFQAAYSQYRTKGVAFVGIDIKEASRGLPRAFVARYGITYPIIYDDKGSVAVTLGDIPAQGAPFTVVLDKKHRVAAVYLQRVEPADLDAVLDTLIAEPS